MRKQIHMINRNGVYYFRRRIPKDLVSHYKKNEIIFSLKTSEHSEADRLQRQESVKLDEEFRRIRKGQLIPELHAISPDLIKSLSDLWTAHILEEDEESRMEGLSEREYDKLTESLDITETGGKAALARGNTSLIEFEMEDFCESQGFKIAKGSDAHKQLSYAFLKASVQANKQQALRHQGEVIETPVVAKLNPPAQHVHHESDTFEALRDYWFMQSGKSKSALRIATTAIKKFRELVGNVRPSEVTKHHTIQLKDKLLEKGTAPATINKDMGILRAIFSTAEANSKLPTNPFKGWKDLSVPEREEEAPYSIEELQLIFNSPVFKDGYRPNQGKGEAAFWLPLIGLYTGCRLNEGAQIFIEDVGELDGIPYFLIKPDSATGRSVKDGKKRRVPIHPDLVRIGLLEYVAKMKLEKQVQLFPELTITRSGGKLGDKWGSWWSNYIRKELGITRIPQPFHAFRHTFVEHGRISKMESELRRIIEGHTPNTVEFKIYGSSQYPLEPLYEEILKLKFRGLDLTHLYIT
ncbi:site-specific integrase [Methylophilus sp. Leaf414]|uniref:site-specific integrase n=1 Tax=Methylophilus sp. Leaf414 TaxID=1736371 RepID=UPI000A846DE6|nr:site-specific integrase [Methylophilus sp. Leaf414]